MPKNPNQPRTRRLLLRAVGVGSSVALLGAAGCSSSSSPTVGMGTEGAEGGVHGTSVHDGGFHDGGFHGTSVHDGGGDSGAVHGIAPAEAGSSGDAGFHGTSVTDAGH